MSAREGAERLHVAGGASASEPGGDGEPAQPAGGAAPGKDVRRAALLLLAYVLLRLAVADGGYLGTDTGGKVATLEAMDERGSFDPDVGYWAAESDPDGRLHPLAYTTRIGDRYVNVTTLPMVLAA